VVRRVALLLLLASVASMGPACKHDPTPAPHAASEPPIPAPATLIASGTLRDPDAFWAHLRKGGGAAFAHAPESAAGAILEWAGVDPGLAPLVAGNQPFHVALGDSADGVASVIAMKLQDIATVRSTLVEAETAHYRGEEIDGMIRLVPRDATPARIGVAVTWSGYLVIASNASELSTLGAYVTRTLPTKPLPTAPFEMRVEPDALGRTGKKGPDLAAKVTGILAATAHSLLPHEVDATALAACFTPGIQDTFAQAGDLTEARLEASADEDRLDVIATLVPGPGDTAARRRLETMHPGSLGPLLDAPRDSVAALFWSDSSSTRTADAGTLGPCLGRALAPILGPGGGSRLADLLASWARGRGDWETMAFVAKTGTAGLVVRAPVADAGVASSTARGFADLASQPSLADAIAGLLPLRAGTVESFDAPRVGKASVVMFPGHTPFSRGLADPSAAAPELAPAGMAWAVDAKEADVAVGQSPRELLALARPATALHANPSIELAMGALGAEASFAAIVAPPGCCAGAGPASAPLLIGWGRHEGHGRANLAVGDELLGQLVVQITSR
jgi:hypothetical protein